MKSGTNEWCLISCSSSLHKDILVLYFIVHETNAKLIAPSFMNCSVELWSVHTKGQS